MSREGPDAEACAASPTSDCAAPNDDQFARAVLQRVDDEVHQTLDVFDGDSIEKLRSLIVPGHLPIIIGSIIKVRPSRPSSPSASVTRSPVPSSGHVP